MSDQGPGTTGAADDASDEVVGLLRSIDSRLEGLPDWRAVVDQEVRERKAQVARLSRLTAWLVGITVVLVVIVVVLGTVVWSQRSESARRERDRQQQAHDARCDIRSALVLVLDVGKASSAQSEAILDQFDRDLDTADCP